MKDHRASNPLPAANSRRLFRFRRLGEIRRCSASSELGSPAAVSEGGRYILAGGFALICVLGVSILALGGREGQSYEGKSLKYWFNQLPLTMIKTVAGKQMILTGGKMETLGLKYGSFLEEQKKAEEAIRAIGTNGVPFFLAKLGRHESSARNWIENRAFRWGLKRHLFDSVEAERGQAVTALICLSPLPDASVRQVIVLSTNADSAIAASAKYVLSSAKPVSRQSILSGN